MRASAAAISRCSCPSRARPSVRSRVSAMSWASSWGPLVLGGERAVARLDLLDVGAEPRDLLGGGGVDRAERGEQRLAHGLEGALRPRVGKLRGELGVGVAHAVDDREGDHLVGALRADKLPQRAETRERLRGEVGLRDGVFQDHLAVGERLVRLQGDLVGGAETEVVAAADLNGGWGDEHGALGEVDRLPVGVEQKRAEASEQRESEDNRQTAHDDQVEVAQRHLLGGGRGRRWRGGRRHRRPPGRSCSVCVITRDALR